MRGAVRSGAQPLPAATVGHRDRRPRDAPRPACPRTVLCQPRLRETTFAEQIPGLAMRYARRTVERGHTNAAALFNEITMRGYRGGQNIVHQYLHQFRTAVRISRPPRKPPSVRRVVGWIMTDPERMTTANQQTLDAILAASPDRDALAGHVRSFATMMCSRRGQELQAWMAAVDAGDQPALRSFVLGLRRDQDAVTAGLTLPWSSGAVEGHAGRLTRSATSRKIVPEPTFGRAGFPCYARGYCTTREFFAVSNLLDHALGPEPASSPTTPPSCSSSRPATAGGASRSWRVACRNW